MSTVFISYARSDIVDARRLYDALNSNGVDVWMDQEKLLPGERWKPAIKREIERCTYFVALLSTTSINRRGYAQKELRIALEILDEFPDNRIFVIPIRLDNCIPTHAALRDLNWLDLFPSFDDGVKRFVTFVKTSASAVIELDNNTTPTSQSLKGTDVQTVTLENVIGTDAGIPLMQSRDRSAITITFSGVSWSWGLRRDYSSGGEDDIILRLKLLFVASNEAMPASISKYELKVFVRTLRGICELLLPGSSRDVPLRYDLSFVDDVDNDTGSSIYTMLTKHPSGGTLQVWDVNGKSYACEFQLPSANLQREYGKVKYDFYE